MFSIEFLVEFCSLIMSVLIIHLNNKRENKNTVQYKLFKIISILLLFNISTNLCRYIFQEPYLKYAFLIAFHIFNVFLYWATVLYCISLTPFGLLNIKKYNKFFIIFYSLCALTILSTPFTKLVYFVENGAIVKGPVAPISFIVGYGSIFLIFFIAIKRNRASINIKREIIVFAILSMGASIIEFINPDYIMHGFGYACGTLVLYQSFQNDEYNISFGIKKEEGLIKKFNKLKLKNRKFSMIFLEFFNFTYLENIDNHLDILVGLSNLFRSFESLDGNPSIYERNNKFYFIIEDIHIEKFVLFLENELDKIIEKYSKNTSYRLVYSEHYNMVDSVNDLSLLTSTKKITNVSEKNLKEINDKKILLNEINDIVMKNDYSDPRVEIFYQPILDVKKNKFMSAEALSRLNIKSLGGLVFPDKFIPILEEHGLIHKFSLIVLSKVCFFIKQLEKEKIDFEGVSVNFSLKEFSEENFVENIVNIVKNNNTNPNRIHIELTESIDSEDFFNVKEKILKLKEFGFKFYLDDFGTGYSNLSKIMEIPFEVIKFDKSLVDKAVEVENDFLTFGMSELFKDRFNVLFEGIENEEYEAFSKKTSVRYLQGYYYSKPIRSIEAINFIGKNYFTKDKQGKN